MKKAILLLCMAAGLMGCAKEILDPGKETPQNEGVPMTFNVSVLETKAAKTAWADGDKIYVFFNGLETKYLVMTYSTSTGWSDTSGGGTLMDTDFSALDTKTLTAVHFPVAVDVTYSDSKFSFTSDGKPVYNYYLYETGKAYTVSGTTVSVTLSLGKPENMVQIHVARIQGNVADYTFGCSKIKPVACESVGTDGAITESVLQAGARLSGVADADGGIFAGRLTKPGEAADYTFTVASDANIFTLTRSSKALTAGKMYKFPSLVTTGGDNWAKQQASALYVDLGITVDGKTIYWAKYNLGATSETDYGDYFAWGEVTGFNEGKTNFASDWSTYYFGASGSFTKYTGSDFDTLEKEDDAAYAALGGKFRMPTKAELDALIETKSNTTDYTWTWCDGSTEKYNDTDVKGWKIVRNATSATLFLPAAGFRRDTKRNSASNGGFYWSSSLITDYPHFARYMDFFYDVVSKGDYNRSDGRSVRPVFAE